jgi:quercetin dioxygenase-like cupin family protein
MSTADTHASVTARSSRVAAVQNCVYEKSATPADDGVETRPLHDRASGSERFTQRVLVFPPGRSAERLDGGADEVLYVLGGAGRVTLGDEKHGVGPEHGFFAAAGTPWSVDADRELLLLSVLVHDPDPASTRNGVVDLSRDSPHAATAGREFRLGVGPEVGCTSVTQFMGFIPPGRAPDHFHRYDEVVYVLGGNGTLHIDGETAPLSPGAAVHLPARLVHSLANDEETEMVVLGVFRPAGSPAEAYYPDGTLATVPES